MRNFSRSGRRSNKTYNGGTEGSRRGGGRVDVRLWTVVLMIFRSGTCTRRRQCRCWWRWWLRVRCTGRNVRRWRILQGWMWRGQRICWSVLEFQDPMRLISTASPAITNMGPYADNAGGLHSAPPNPNSTLGNNGSYYSWLSATPGPASTVWPRLPRNHSSRDGRCIGSTWRG